ncbi:MAG TPA: NAD(P)H-quinone oxidoreductase [Candidatus Binataceae bacterium]|jgi:putative PIG3 family NAD(P)H quinone oxidoreductase|nr:NAD(P)H-quinone oxidoreductase [Candidatus Binataceae bacterium]
MKAILIEKPGDESVLQLGDAPDPQPGPADLLINVKYAALNRADLMQRQGLYPPPPGASPILGLECSGEVAAVGADVAGWRVGDRAMALLPGGGYAERVVVHHGSAIHLPGALTYAEAAALPEVFLTAFLNLFMLAGIKAGDSALIHGGGSGVGTASIQLLGLAGARSIVTAGSDLKCEQCLRFGAGVAINYNSGPFAPKVRAATNDRGVEVILDSIGGAYLAQNLEALANGGCLVLIGLMNGAKAELDLATVLRRHLRIVGSTLRTRPAAEKAQIVAAFLTRFGGPLEAGQLRPPIYRTLALHEAAQGHRMMQASEHFGKIVLRVS